MRLITSEYDEHVNAWINSLSSADYLKYILPALWEAFDKIMKNG